MELKIENIIQVILRKHEIQRVKYFEEKKFKNVTDFISSVNDSIISNIEDQKDAYFNSKISNQDILDNLSDFILEYSSNLYAFGADVNLCKQWLSVYTCLRFIKKDFFDAPAYCILIEEYSLLKIIPQNITISKQLPDQVLNLILSSNHEKEIVDNRYDSEVLRKQYNILLNNIPGGDTKKLNTAFEKIYQWYYENGWLDEYEYGQFPLFEPAICALFALAIRNGYIPNKMTKRQFLFYRIAVEEKKYKNLFYYTEKGLIFDKNVFLMDY